MNRSFLYGLLFLGCTSCVLRTTGGFTASGGTEPPPGGTGVAPPADPTGTGPAVAPPATPAGVRGVIVTSVRQEGEVFLSGGVGFDAGGNLILSMPAVRHPETGLTIGPGGVALTLNARIGGGAMIGCGIGSISSSAKAPTDVVFINDTTGSMSGTVNGINDSITSFASDLASSGVDARFSMYTYGDAFATKRAGSKFYVGRGDFSPPSFDDTSRPYLGLTDVYTFQRFMNELKSSGELGVGGGDDPENTLGALAYANRTVAWRYGASRTFVVIGDNPSHQAGDGSSSGWGMWQPPSPDNVIASLAGSAVVHVISEDKNAPGMYNIRYLANRTGGIWNKIPSGGRIDLNRLGMSRIVSSGFRGLCSAVGTGTVELSVTATVMGARMYSGRLIFNLQVS